MAMPEIFSCSLFTVYGYRIYGLWLMVYGLWFTVYGLWFMVYGLWFVVCGENCIELSRVYITGRIVADV